MKKSTLILILLLALIAGGVGYFRYSFSRMSSSQSSSEKVAPTPSSAPSENAALAQLNASQRIAQLFAVPVTITARGETDAQMMSWIASQSAGVVTIFGENISTTSAQKTIGPLKTSAKGQSTLAPFIAIDHEGGTVQRLRGAGYTRLPSWRELCAASAESRQQLLQRSAKELETSGIDIVLGPVVDVGTSSAALKNRTCAADADIVAQRASEWIETFAKVGIQSVIKHYPGLGTNMRDTHHAFDRVSPPAEEKAVFGNLLQHFPQLHVMSAHVGENAAEVPCSLDRNCLKNISLNQQQLLFTDSLGMKAVMVTPTGEQRDLAEVAIQALEVGNTVLIFGPGTSPTELSRVHQALVERYQQQPEFKKLVDERATKVLLLKNTRQSASH